MQIVIDIPDNYDSSKIQNGSIASKVILNAVANGVPLPKGHGRLIDADALQTEMDKDVRRAMSFVDLKDFVWLAPTIIESDKGESER